jgi:hypothetical protein
MVKDILVTASNVVSPAIPACVRFFPYFGNLRSRLRTRSLRETGMKVSVKCTWDLDGSINSDILAVHKAKQYSGNIK